MPSAAVSADASNRSVRTLIQGLLVDVAVAVATTLLALLTDWPAGWTWALIGAALAKSALQAGLAYWMRVQNKLPGLAAPVIEGQVAGVPVTVTVGGYTLVPQQPGVADHSPDAVAERVRQKMAEEEPPPELPP
jgi:hypothetical protein